MNKTNLLLLHLLVGLLLVACRQEDARIVRLQAERQVIEDSIGAGCYTYAFRQTDRYMKEASDSNAYYLWLATRNKVFFSKMMEDSMIVAERRIEGFLERHSAEQYRALDMLRAEWYLSKGASLTVFDGRPDSALAYNKKAVEVLRKYGDTGRQLLTALTNTADSYRQLGKLDFSTDVYLQALALADSMKADNKARIEVELGISTAYSFMGDYDNGNRWWEMLETKVDSMSYDDKCIFYNNRGNDLYFQSRYREAMPYFVKAAELTKGHKNKEWQYYTALYNIGEIQVCLGKGNEARDNLDVADTFFKKVGYDMGHFYAVTSYIALALLDSSPNEALRLMENNPVPSHMIPIAIMHRLQQEERVMTAVGNYRRAYDIHKRLDNIQDSIQTANMKMRMNANLLRFKHDRQLAEQRHVIDQQHIINIMAWALCIVALLLVAILVAFIFLQRKRNQLRTLSEQQKIIRLRMENTRNRISPHFIYNALNHELLAQLKGKKVDLYALTQLLRCGVTQAGNLETTLKEEMKFVNYYVGIEGQQMGDDFQYDVTIEPALDIEKVKLPAMTVQIFAENAIKHGLRAMTPREGKQRLLHVNIGRCDGQYTLVEVIDNGLGLDNTYSKGHTGLRIVRQTIQILNDKNKKHISFGIENSSALEESHTGCRSWIMIPDEYDYTL